MARVLPGVIVRGNTLEVTFPQCARRSGTGPGALRRPSVVAIASWETGGSERVRIGDPAALDPTRMPVQPFQTNYPRRRLRSLAEPLPVQHRRNYSRLPERSR